MSGYVGMDVHRKRSQVAIVDAAGVPHRNLANDPAKLVPVLGALPPGTPVAFEGCIAVRERIPGRRQGGRIQAIRRLLEPRLPPGPALPVAAVPAQAPAGLAAVGRRPILRPCRHLRVHPLAAPGDQAQLLQVCPRLYRRRLDPPRPLWEGWLLPGRSRAILTDHPGYHRTSSHQARAVTVASPHRS